MGEHEVSRSTGSKACQQTLSRAAVAEGRDPGIQASFCKSRDCFVSCSSAPKGSSSGAFGKEALQAKKAQQANYWSREQSAVSAQGPSQPQQGAQNCTSLQERGLTAAKSSLRAAIFEEMSKCGETRHQHSKVTAERKLAISSPPSKHHTWLLTVLEGSQPSPSRASKPPTQCKYRWWKT